MFFRHVWPQHEQHRGNKIQRKNVVTTQGNQGDIFWTDTQNTKYKNIQCNLIERFA